MSMKVKGILFDMVRSIRCSLFICVPDYKPRIIHVGGCLPQPEPDQDGTLTDSDSLHYECYRDTLLRFAPEYNGEQERTGLNTRACVAFCHVNSMRLLKGRASLRSLSMRMRLGIPSHPPTHHADGRPLDRGYYDQHMSGSSNEIIVPKLLPHWELEQMKELWLAKETLYRERSVRYGARRGATRRTRGGMGSGTTPPAHRSSRRGMVKEKR